MFNRHSNISDIVLRSYGFGAYFNILPGSEWSALMLTYGFPLSIIGMALKVNHSCFPFFPFAYILHYVETNMISNFNDKLYVVCKL